MDTFMGTVYFEDETFEGGAVALPKGEYDRCVFSNCDLSGKALSGFRFVDCAFRGCNLSLAKVSNTVWRDVAFSDCKMLGLRFDQCAAFGLAVSFERCQLNYSSFQKTKIRKTVFAHSLLQEVDFTDCDMSQAVFDHCDLDRAVFHRSGAEGTDFRTAFNFVIDPEANKIRKALFSIQGLPGLLGKYDIVIEP